MKEELLKISYVENGEKHEWISVGTYDDPKHPRRKYCYSEGGPWTTWFDGAENLQDCLSWLWKNVIDAKAVIEKNLTIIVEKA